jgi:hypothetical protein
MMTKQEIFARVADHLLNQGKAAQQGWSSVCRYRTDEGLHCAVGVLIKDRYDPACEGASMGGVGVGPGGRWEPDIPDVDPADATAVEALVRCLNESEVPADLGVLRMLIELQDMHDNDDAAVWRQRLVSMAGRHGIEWQPA